MRLRAARASARHRGPAFCNSAHPRRAASKIKSFQWQPSSRARSDPQRLFGALANLGMSSTSPSSTDYVVDVILPDNRRCRGQNEKSHFLGLCRLRPGADIDPEIRAY